MKHFTHLHVHTEYSILDGASNIDRLILKVKNSGMKSIAITDHGNMFGVKLFHKIARSKGIKPIIGCEVYVARGKRTDRSDKNDRGHHLIILAKNETGYHNLIKLVSYGYTEGFYYNPRIDKELLEKYKEGLIVSSACIGGEVQQAILNKNPEKAKEVILYFKKIFGDDYYLEIQRHFSGVEKIDADVYQRQQIVSEQFIKLSKELGVKIIATNDIHFVDSDDAESHDRLICINTGKNVNDPDRLQYTKQEYLKTPEEMYELFADYEEALTNTSEVEKKIENYELDHDPVMPDFPLPEEFNDADEYLKHLTYMGAEIRYKNLSEDIRNRIDFELETVKKMGYPGYFLIVQDFISAARKMGVSVGPGRGSAAGSVVAYCLKITEIDPLKYNLLFERFLNPDRVSMPDIDIDFDEDGRDEVLKYVVKKYGEKKVAQIITFGKMAPRMAIRDVARVQQLPLNEADKIAKLVPERPGTDFLKAYQEVPELSDLRKNGLPEIASVLKHAEKLEGTVRNVGIHACGVIIGKNNLEEHIPICTSKESTLIVTQYEGKYIEDAGMLKMDFLGLKTLSIIKDALQNIKMSTGLDDNIDEIPLDDKKTYELYSRGDTTSVFQFESEGMKKHLKDLKPNRFEDLIAMNALYRPGPMEYIPRYISRKYGKEKIEYDLPEMKEFLEDTYGIIVYQEQVMLLSQKLAGFTKGEADSLRKAMGKKIPTMMEQLKIKYIDGCIKNGHPDEKAQKIWHDCEAFAEYAFNKSHSTCYALISYQTAWLKAHYPAHFMAAVLSRNLNDIKKISFFMEDCRRMGIEVAGPDLNESHLRFNVNKKGQIRFGLGAVKGVGEAAVNNIISEKENNGPYLDVFNFVERVSLQAVNKKTLEALSMAGAFDGIGNIKRHQFFFPDSSGQSFIENLIRFGNKMQLDQGTTQQSLFGGVEAIEINKPEIPAGIEWSTFEVLEKEKEVVGMYISAHPLDDFAFDIKHFCTNQLSDLNNLNELQGKPVVVAGIITGFEEKTTKTGSRYCTFSIEDYSGNYRHTFFSKEFMKFKNFLSIGYMVVIQGKVLLNEWKKDKNELELNIDNISLLSEIREKIRNIIIKIPIDALTDELINDIDSYVKKNKGKTTLKFFVVNHADNVSIEMFSRSNSVYVSNEFIGFLQRNTDIEYKII
ncbi:MAG: DNA polymerase III subunit alpha [Bacteroidota bacterium]